MNNGHRTKEYSREVFATEENSIGHCRRSYKYNVERRIHAKKIADKCYQTKRKATNFSKNNSSQEAKLAERNAKGVYSRSFKTRKHFGRGNSHQEKNATLRGLREDRGIISSKVKPYESGNSRSSIRDKITTIGTKCLNGRVTNICNSFQKGQGASYKQNRDRCYTDDNNRKGGRSNFVTIKKYGTKNKTIGEREYYIKQKQKYRNKRSKGKTRKRGKRKEATGTQLKYREQLKKNKALQQLKEIGDVLQFHNLCDENTLSLTDKLVLSLGLKYLPKQTLNLNDQIDFLMTSIKKYGRALKLKIFFKDTEKQNGNSYKLTFQNNNKNNWEPYPRNYEEKTAHYEIDKAILQGKQEIINQTCKIYKSQRLSRLDKLILNTLYKLKKRTDIEIKAADKNLGLTVMPKQLYHQLALQAIDDVQLKKQDIPQEIIINKIWAKLRLILNNNNLLFTRKRKYNGTIAKTLTSFATYLLQLEKHTELRLPVFYVLPKLHKEGKLKGRPITSSINSPTYFASKYVASRLQPFRKKFQFYCTRSSDVVIDLENKTFSDNPIIITADIKSLYPSLPNAWVLSQISDMLTSFGELDIAILLQLIQWILENNYCIFNNDIYLQMDGLAMGTPCAVALADLALSWFEYNSFPILPTNFFYRRYIDDMLIIGNDIMSNTILSIMGSMPAKIDAKSITMGNSGIFLDLELALRPKNPSTSLSSLTSHTSHNSSTGTTTSLTHIPDYQISTKLFQKTISKFQYILWTSRHRSAVFKNLVISELKRYRLFSTDDLDYEKAKELFQERLMRRRYSHLFVFAAHCIPDRETLLQSARNLHNNILKDETSHIIAVGRTNDPKNDPYNWKKIFFLPEYLKKDPYFNSYFQKVIIAMRHHYNIGQMVASSRFTANNVTDDT